MTLISEVGKYAEPPLEILALCPISSFEPEHAADEKTNVAAKMTLTHDAILFFISITSLNPYIS